MRRRAPVAHFPSGGGFAASQTEWLAEASLDTKGYPINMKIAVLGAGTLGVALAESWTAKGHQVAVGVRNAKSEKARALADSGKARVRSIADAAAGAEVVVLAVPWDGALEAVRMAGGLDGKIVVDPINSFTPEMALAVGFNTSVAEEIAKAAPNARVVKAFNTLGMSNLQDLVFAGQTASGFICGDDAAAKAIVSALAREMGFDVVDCGPLRNARALEPLALLWGQLAFVQKLGPNIAFKLLRR
jgi:NADPH-dependent F420 reductase